MYFDTKCIRSHFDLIVKSTKINEGLYYFMEYYLMGIFLLIYSILLGAVAYFIGATQERNKYLLEQIIESKKSVDNLGTIDGAGTSGAPAKGFTQPTQSRVMKYPTAEEIRKRRDAKNEEKYHESATQLKSKGGSYVI